MTDTQALKFCIEMLPKVSRTFAINIRILKGELYRAVLVAYLFCRMVDTVEDAENLSMDLRNRLLDDYVALFRSSVHDAESVAKWIALFGDLDPSDPQQRLIQDSRFVFGVFFELPSATRGIISDCVVEMTQGMKRTLNQQRPQEPLHTLRTTAELEQYCYYVAGTVGIMLTRLFATYSRLLNPSAARVLTDLQLSFALGLQMTNIIKDCAEDFRRGWCYIPADLAARFGVSVTDFLAPENAQQSLATLDDLTIQTARHLDGALTYAVTLPRREVRMRLFNLWSLFFAVKTLGKAWHNKDLLSSKVKIKISRAEVYWTLVQTTMLVTSNSLLRLLYEHFRRRIPA